MKYCNVLDLITHQINTNGEGYTNMFNREMSLLIYGDIKFVYLVKTELIRLQRQGKIIIVGTQENRKIYI